jgi:hypothetical protein
VSHTTRLVLLAFATALSSCAHTPAPPPEAPRIAVHVEDDPAHQRFLIEVTLVDVRKACVEDETLPTQIGTVVNGSRIRLRTIGAVLAPEENNGGFCPGGCYSEMQPGESRKRFVNYSVFGNAEQIASLLSRTLEFSPDVFWCPKERAWTRKRG